MRLLTNLWNDDRGALLTAEWIFLATIIVIGLTVGLKTIQSALVNELEETASAFGALSQSYSFGGTSGCCARTGGSFFFDSGPNTYPITTCSPVTAQEPVSCAD